MLSVRELDVFYGRLQAVRRLSMEVQKGQIVALLGSNGAGKSSVIRALCGLTRVSGQSLQFEGRTLNRLRPEQRVALGVATVPEGHELFPSLTVRENLLMGAYKRRGREGIKRDLHWIHSLFPVLGYQGGVLAAALSGGQAQMLSIGRALMSNPRLLLLDEPSHGLAPKLADEVLRVVKQMSLERELSILLVEQNAHKALVTATYAYVMEAGELALEGPTRKLMRDPRVQQLYLGD
jgi:branched-chain amino acid transport system ATP-binding protein